MKDNVIVPNFGKAPSGYDSRYFDDLNRQLTLLFREMISRGDTTLSGVRIFSLQTTDASLRDGEVWNDGGLLRLNGAGGTTSVYAKGYETRADLAAASVPSIYNLAIVGGFATYGDGGGALYKRVVSEPSHNLKVQSADGAWWELVSDPGRVSVLQAGAVGDGVTDDTTAITNADGLGGTIMTTYNKDHLTTFSFSNAPKAIDGDGLVTVTGSDKLPKTWRRVDTAPSSIGNESGFNTAFNGDWSKGFNPIGMYLSGAATLGQPTTGFRFNNELCPHYVYLRNVDSGHNQSLTDDTGRTTWPGFRMRGFHSGQGGMMGFTSTIFVNSTQRPGVTTFLANAAAECFNGTTFAGANGVYLNPLEISMDDQGFDAAAIGPVVNMTRTNTTGAAEAFWSGMRIQSKGTSAINSGYQISGKADTGIDFTKADFSSGTEAAIALKAGQRIYLGASSTNNWHKTANGSTWLRYASGNAAIEFSANGAEGPRINQSGEFEVIRAGTENMFRASNTTTGSTFSGMGIGGNGILTAGSTSTDTVGWLFKTADAGTENTTLTLSGTGRLTQNPRSADVNAFKIQVNADNRWAHLGQSGGFAYVGGGSDSTDDVGLVLRTASGGTEQNSLVMQGNGNITHAPATGSTLNHLVQPAGTTVFAGFGSTSGTAFFGGGSSATDTVDVVFRTSVSGTEQSSMRLVAAGHLDILNASGEFRVNGTKVVTSRQTGWGAPTGTATRTTYATFAGQTITNPPTQTEVQNIDDHVVILSQRLKALIDDLTTHGLIGT